LRRSAAPGLFVLSVLLLSGAPSPAKPHPDRAAPLIESVKAVGKPVAGEPAQLEIKVRDPLAAINGIQVDFGDGHDALKQSACRPGAVAVVPFAPGKTTTFVVTHVYRLPGTFDLSLTATSGDCVIGALESRKKLRVKVRLAKHPLKLPALASAADGCPAANALPVAGDFRTTLCLVNTIRRARGLKKLRSNRRLRLTAQAHARDMVARGYFAHESPGGTGLAARLRKARYRADRAAENIGAGSDSLATPLAMMISWMESPPHRANLLERAYDEAGVGVALGFPGGGDGATYTLDLGTR
jgi:uncharacterized protein YkwD